MVLVKSSTVALAIVLLSAPAAAQTPAEQFEAWLCANAPSTPACRGRAAPLPLAKPAEIKPPALKAVPKAQRTDTTRSPPADRSRSQSKPAAKQQPKPPADVCAKIAWGLSMVSRERAIQEAGKRGHSRAVTERTMKECGFP